MSDFVSFAEIDIEGLGPVDSVVSFSVDDGDTGTEVVHTMRRSPRALGYTTGKQEVRITFEAKRTNPVEIDWWTWKNNQEEKLVQYEELTSPNADGQRWHLENVRIVGISKSRSANEADDTIEAMATYHGPQV